jgi:hypothetical protein
VSRAEQAQAIAHDTRREWSAKPIQISPSLFSLAPNLAPKSSFELFLRRLSGKVYQDFNAKTQYYVYIET